MTYTRRDWLRDATRRLAAASIEAPQLVATLVLGHVLELAKEQVITRDHHPLADDQLAEAEALIERRLAGEPLAYVVGSIEFYGHRFNLTHDVLVPRSETEQLVEFVLERASEWMAESQREHWTLVDIGTGTGCIPIAVALSDPRVRAIGTDIRDAALAVAHENIWLHGMQERVTLLPPGDLFEPLASERPELRGRVDVLTSNPPYIDPVDEPSLRPEVLIQPHVALFAGAPGAGGTVFYERLLTDAAEWLRPDGWLVMELGIGQADTVRELAESNDAWDADSILVLPDFADIDRVFAVQRRR